MDTNRGTNTNRDDKVETLHRKDKGWATVSRRLIRTRGGWGQSSQCSESPDTNALSKYPNIHI